VVLALLGGHQAFLLELAGKRRFALLKPANPERGADPS